MNSTTLYIFIGIVIGIAIGYSKLKSRFSKKVIEPTKQFPYQWRSILERKVDFYRKLSRENKKAFEKKVHVFLLNENIIGKETTVTHNDRILLAAGAVIPIFGFKKWHYANLKEIHLYPDMFQIPNTTQMATGLVGYGEMEGKMLISRKALEHGFYDPNDQRNVAIHEFIHILDKQDGKIDGVLGTALRKDEVMPWLSFINMKMNEISKGNSSIRSYGAANQAEFLSVVSEYFFESPEKLKLEHPNLYQELDKMFNQRDLVKVNY